MLSRVACVPRVCLNCRLGLFQRRTALSVSALSYQDRQIRRHYHARDSVVQSKERIEALISGKIFDSKDKGKGNKSQKKKGSRRTTTKGKAKAKTKAQAKSKADKDEDLPDWGFSFSRDKKGVKAQVRVKHDVKATNQLVGEAAEIKEPMIEESQMPKPEKPKPRAIKPEKPKPQAIKPAKPKPQAPEPEMPKAEAPEPQVQAVSIEKPDIEEFEIKEAVNEEPEPFEAEESQTKPSPIRQKRHRKRYQNELVHSRFLGKEALGRPLVALMVKNPNKMKKSKKPIRMLEEEKLAKAVDLHWKDLMPKVEEHDDLMNEAIQNIEALQPVDTTILSMKDFDNLQRELVDGYTYNQLVAYFHRKLKKLDTHRNEPVKYDWIVEQTPWEPSQPDHWEKLTPKSNYAIMIVRRLWNIEVKEQVEGLGRLQIWLRPEVFKLISGPSSQVLRSLAAKYLYKSNKERIEGSLDESRLDIFARKSIMPVFLARLDEIASSMTLQKVSAKDLREEDLTSTMLQEVARITGTFIHYDEENAELQVSWLANEGRPPSIANQGQVSSQTESPADIMMRLLMGWQTKEREQQTSVQILTRLEESEANHGRFISHQRETRSMSWREKLQSWFRYVSPVSKLPVQDMESEPAVEFSDKISLPKSSAKATRSAAKPEIVTATFGHILHNKAVMEEKEQMAENFRILSPVVPHPAALTPITRETVRPVSQHTSIILNFTPSLSTQTITTTTTNPTGQNSKSKTSKEAKKPAAAAGHVPELQLRLPVDPDADLSQFSLPPDSTLHGILDRRVHDVLLPGESVDVRLARHTLLPLDIETQPLREFLATCDFNLLEGRLRTPSEVDFSIPSSWMSSSRGPKSKKLVNVAYQFMGLELHQVVEVEWRGHTLKYNSIEAGQHGGQRQELSLQGGPPLLQADKETLPSTLDKDGKLQFFQLVEDLAAGKYFSWHQGYKSMRERPSKDVAFEELPEEYEVEVEEDGGEEEEAALSPEDTSAWGEEGQHIPFSTTETENTPTKEEPAVENKDSASATTENSVKVNAVPDASSQKEVQSDHEPAHDNTKTEKSM